MGGAFDLSGFEWLNEPRWRTADGVLELEAAEGSDLWQVTGYGFTRDTGHALLHPLGPGDACEVDVHATMTEQFDQAGLLVRVDDKLWLKAGLELADGRLGLGAVFTDGRSDWSTGPVDDWSGSWVRFRVSRGPDHLTVRARPEGGQWQLVRLVPFTPDGPVGVGPYACSPSRAGFVARFRDHADGSADQELH